MPFRLLLKSPSNLIFSSPRLILVLLIITYFVYFGSYAAQRHQAFETGAFDLGVYAQPLWNYLQGRDFAVSLIEDNGPIRWATHVEPILFLILPIYKLWPDPRALLWLQVAAISLTAIPLYALAIRRLQNEWIALVIALTFFLLPATESVTLFDFHAVTFAPLFLLSAIYFLDQALTAQGKSLWLWPEAPSVGQTVSLSGLGQANSFPYKVYLLSALFFMLALSTKEDISLHVFMIGLYLLALRRRPWEGVSLIIVGLIWFYVTFQVIIPAFRTGGGESIYVAWFETLGDTPLEIALSPITAPDKVLALIFRPGNIPALGMLTVPLALLPLIGLPFLALAAPSIAFSFLSQNPTLRQLETWHYAAPMLPFVMLATIDGLARLNYWVSSFKFQVSGDGDQATDTKSTLPRLTFYASRFTPYLLPLTLLLTTLIYHNLRGYSHFSRLYERPAITAHHQLGHKLAATIPEEASVLAQAQLIPHVAHRSNLGIWSGPLFTDYDYIWLDLSHPKLPNRFNAHGELLTGLIIETEFGTIAAEDGYLLLKKGAKRDVIPKSLFSFTEFDHLPPDAQPFDATFGESLRLIGLKTEVRRLATSETEPQVILFFEVLKKPNQDYRLFVYRIGQTGIVEGATDYPQPAIFWWPTSRWEAGDKRQVRVNTIPWWTGDEQIFGYALGLTSSDDRWDVAARLPITLGANETSSQLIDDNTLLPIAAFKRFAGLPYPQPLATLHLAGKALVKQQGKQ